MTAPMRTSHSLPALLQEVRRDLSFYGGKTWRSRLAIVLFDARFRLMCSYRISRYLYLRRNRHSWIHRLLTYRQLTRGANDLSARATIGARLVLPHPVGIVIGDDAIVEDDVTIFQQVTLGSHGRRGESKKYPVVKAGAKLFAGAKVIGGVRIGNRATVGANSVVTSDVPDDSTAAGVPARVIAR
jgi:serine O-acetyltransferase